MVGISFATPALLFHTCSFVFHLAATQVLTSLDGPLLVESAGTLAILECNVSFLSLAELDSATASHALDALPASINRRVCGAAFSAGNYLVDHSTKPAITSSSRWAFAPGVWTYGMMCSSIPTCHGATSILPRSWHLPVTSLAHRPRPQPGQGKGLLRHVDGAPHGPQVPRT